jgi:hypothetical protein
MAPFSATKGDNKLSRTKGHFFKALEKIYVIIKAEIIES